MLVGLASYIYFVYSPFLLNILSKDKKVLFVQSLSSDSYPYFSLLTLSSHSYELGGLITYHMITFIQVQKVPSCLSFRTRQLLRLQTNRFPQVLKALASFTVRDCGRRSVQVSIGLRPVSHVWKTGLHLHTCLRGFRD